MELSITVANVENTKWLYNGKKVGPSVKLDEQNDTFTLSIASMKKSNAGTYVFEASSVTGHVLKESFDVHFRGKYLKPSFEMKNTNTMFFLFVFSCTFLDAKIHSLTQKTMIYNNFSHAYTQKRSLTFLKESKY